MRVYFAAAMTNPGRDLAVLAALLEHIEARGHTVPTRHIVRPDGKELDRALTDEALARRDLAWIAECDVLVAEVSTPSHGVGVEVMAAAGRPMPVLLLRRAGAPLSRLLAGLPGVAVSDYASMDEARAGIDGFLAQVGR